MSVSIFLSFFFFLIFVSYLKEQSIFCLFLSLSFEFLIFYTFFFGQKIVPTSEAVTCIKRSVANYIRTQSFHVKTASAETTIPRRSSATFMVRTVSVTSWTWRELTSLQNCICCLLDSDKTVGTCICVRLQYKR